MALGNAANVQNSKGNPPLAVFTFTQVGDGAYVAGGTTGLLAKLRALYGMQYTIISASGWALVGGVLRSCFYDVANDKLVCFAQNNAEEANGSLAAVTYNITAVCK